MTSVQINRVGTDSTELELVTSGSNEASIILNKNLLDGSKQYHFACTQLSVPLGNTPIFPDTVNTDLFTVMRRNVGSSLTDITDYQAAC